MTDETANNLAAILASDETVVMFGESVKAMPGGRIGGLLAPFGSPASTDKKNDYFTVETDFGLDVSTRARVMVHHGYTKAFGRRKIGVVGMTLGSLGVEVAEPLVLDLSDPAQRLVYEDAEQNKLYWSTGTSPHLMERDKVGSANHVKSWPIVEASLTYTPVNRGAVAMALKAIVEAGPADLILNEFTEPEAVTASTLVARSQRLVTDSREILGLFAKASDHRKAEGRDLSPEKRDALKAMRDEYREHIKAIDGMVAVPRVDPDQYAAMLARARNSLRPPSRG